jgi:hypothetical protein
MTKDLYFKNYLLVHVTTPLEFPLIQDKNNKYRFGELTQTKFSTSFRISDQIDCVALVNF